MGAERITYTIARYVLDPIDEGINSTLERRVYKSEIYGMFRLSHYRSRHTGGELEEDTDKNSHDSSNSSGDDGAEDEGNESGNGEGDGAAGGDGAAAGGGFSFYFGDPPDTPDVAPVAAATAIMEKELASLWEKMRRLDIGKEDPSKLMKAKIPDSAGSNVSSCVLQTCVKYCSQAEKEAVFIELQPHFLNLASNTYAVFLLKKMLDGEKTRKDWSSKLDDALSAYRTTFKTPKGTTPFQLFYEKACHLPVELEYKAAWAVKHMNYDIKTTSERRLIQLNELDGILHVACENTKIHKERTKIYHEKNIVPKSFSPNDQMKRR